MKTSDVLAVVLASLATAGCVSREKPLQLAGGYASAAQDDAAEDGRAIVSQLVEVHHETVGQMRVSAGLRAQQRSDCN